MAVLKKITVCNYRNIEMAELAFARNVNCICGGNGEGKTNLVDSIFYLSMTKSAFRFSDKDSIRHGATAFSITGDYAMDGLPESRFSISVTADGEKKLKKGAKAYTRISDHIGELPVVMVSPYDISLVSDSGEERRRFMNMVISQVDKEYMSSMVAYNRLLAQRNQMLKADFFDSSLLEVVDMKMDSLGASIYEKRRNFVSGIAPLISKYYSLLSGGKENVSMEYRSDLDKASLQDLLQQSRSRDRRLGYTSVGIQRDDLLLVMDGYPVRQCGSQGQQKSYLVSLKFAQCEMMRYRSGISPILLLDDVFDKLDMARTSNLLSMVAGNEFGQIFITDSNKVRLSAIVDGITTDRAYFEAVSGTFKELK